MTPSKSLLYMKDLSLKAPKNIQKGFFRPWVREPNLSDPSESFFYSENLAESAPKGGPSSQASPNPSNATSHQKRPLSPSSPPALTLLLFHRQDLIFSLTWAVPYGPTPPPLPTTCCCQVSILDVHRDDTGGSLISSAARSIELESPGDVILASLSCTILQPEKFS